MLVPAALPLALVACVSTNGLALPLDNVANRPTPLHFGLHVTPDPEQNPIDPPERFTGYHAAVDFEVSADELETEVPVYAVCRGRVVYSGFAEGYGGVLVHRCRIEGEDVTVLYGHLSQEGLPAEGATVKPGQRLGVLAAARSTDSGDTRKHLHLGIRKGRELDLRGYVQTEEELLEFHDPALILPLGGVDAALPDPSPYWQTATGSGV